MTTAQEASAQDTDRHQFETSLQVSPPGANDRPLRASASGDEEVLDEIAQRVLWLATSIIDRANRGRTNPDGVKVGGHQSSSASMTGIMTALWFTQLRARSTGCRFPCLTGPPRDQLSAQRPRRGIS